MQQNFLDSLYRKYPIYRELFLEQLEFVLCPDRFIALLCGRRAGKTTAVVAKCISELSQAPNSLGLYLGLTDDSIRRIVVPILKHLLRKYNIKHTLHRNVAIFENGSEFVMLGAHDVDKIESFRGTKLSICAVDECGSFKDRIFHSLIEEVLRPALVDLQGQLIITGTPSNRCSGLFYDATMGKDSLWVLKSWLGFANPYTMNQLKKESDTYKDKTQPKYRREYLAQWCTDQDALLIKEPFIIDHPPYSKDTHRSVIGVDYGYNDETVFSVLVWRNNSRVTCVYESFGESGLNVTQIANKLLDLNNKYQPALIVADPAGSGKILMEDFMAKHKIYIQRSQKNNKADYIEIFNDAIQNKKLVVNSKNTEKLLLQIGKVTWNKERTRENEGQACDHIDAALYAFRESFAYTEAILEHREKTQEEIEEDMYQKYLGNFNKKRGIEEEDAFVVEDQTHAILRDELYNNLVNQGETWR